MFLCAFCIFFKHAITVTKNYESRKFFLRKSKPTSDEVTLRMRKFVIQPKNISIWDVLLFTIWCKKAWTLLPIGPAGQRRTSFRLSFGPKPSVENLKYPKHRSLSGHAAKTGRTWRVGLTKAFFHGKLLSMSDAQQYATNAQLSTLRTKFSLWKERFKAGLPLSWYQVDISLNIGGWFFWFLLTGQTQHRPGHSNY